MAEYSTPVYELSTTINAEAGQSSGYESFLSDGSALLRTLSGPSLLAPSPVNHRAKKHKDVRKYFCKNCHKVFTESSNLYRHIWEVHNDAFSHACTKCGVTFATSRGLNQHFRTYCSVEPVQCEVCFKSYTLSSTLRPHKRLCDSSSGGRPSTGPMLQLPTSGPSPSSVSQQSPVLLPGYMPSYPGMFSNDSNIHNAFLLFPQHNKVSPSMGKEATLTFRPSPARSPLPAATETDEESSRRPDHPREAERMEISFAECATSSSNDETDQPLDLRVETKRNSPAIPPLMEVSTVETSKHSEDEDAPMRISEIQEISSLQLHGTSQERNNLSTPPYMAYPRPINNNHRHHQTGKMKDRYTCKYCGKVLARSSELQCHLRVHTGERPYKCKYCDIFFTTPSNLFRHMRIMHHNQRSFKCPPCKRYFACQSNLERHWKKHKADDGNCVVSVADSSGTIIM